MIAETIPIERVEPIGLRIFVRKYERPEKVGSIWLNPAWRVDHSRALWEVIKPSEKAQSHLEKVFGAGLEEDWIVLTHPNKGAHVPPVEVEGDREVFMIFATDILKVIPWGGEIKEMIPGLQVRR